MFYCIIPLYNVLVQHTLIHTWEYKKKYVKLKNNGVTIWKLKKNFCYKYFEKVWDTVLFKT